MERSDPARVPLDLDRAGPWERVYTVAPLVVIGTREADGYDLAPKHQATPLGWSGLFGFVCTPDHATYRNAVREETFTVTYPPADGVVLASLAASPRCADGSGEKPIVEALPTFDAETIDGVFLEDGTLFLECELVRTIDDLGDAHLVVGRVVHAMAYARALRVSDGDDREVLRRSPPLAYLFPDRFGRVSETETFPFPEGFRR
ncbi:MAG: flavin reductase [Gemmatimonadota bacterium]|nr:flavin reductase [Gemmatimonadota bacterium]